MLTRPLRAYALIAFLAVGFGHPMIAAPIQPDLIWAMSETAIAHVGFYPDKIAFFSNSQLAIFNSQNGQMAIWDLNSREGTTLVDTSGLGRFLDLSSDRTTLAVCTHDDTIEFWNVNPLERIRTICSLENTSAPRGAFSPSGSFFAFADSRTVVKLWNLETDALDAIFTGHNSNLFDLAFSPDEQMLATAGGWSGSTTDADSCIKIWSIAGGELMVSLPTIDIGDNHAIAFADNGARLISGGIERMVVWDTTSWERVYDSGASYLGNSGIDVSPNEQLLAIAYWGGSVRLVDLTTMRTCRDIGVDERPVDVAFSPDGAKLAVSFFNGSVIVWSIP